MSILYDLAVRNATIVDGTGTPAFQGSVGIQGAKIAVLGDVSGEARRTVDGSGLVVCPGFIDPHSHADGSIIEYPHMCSCNDYLTRLMKMKNMTHNVQGLAATLRQIIYLNPRQFSCCSPMT